MYTVMSQVHRYRCLCRQADCHSLNTLVLDKFKVCENSTYVGMRVTIKQEMEAWAGSAACLKCRVSHTHLACQVTAIHSPKLGEPSALFWLWQALHTHTMHIHTCSQNTRA